MNSEQPSSAKAWYQHEDYLSIAVASLFLFAGFFGWLFMRPDNITDVIADQRVAKLKLGKLSPDEDNYDAQRASLKQSIAKMESQISPRPFKPWIVKPEAWTSNPIDAFYHGDKNKKLVLVGLLSTFTILLIPFSFAILGCGESPISFAIAFVGLFFLGSLAYVLAGQKFIQGCNLEYVLWALLLGLLISNTIGLPKWLEPASKTEIYIKTGLVLLGVEVLFNKLVSLGVPGILISWVTTPIVLIATYLFGQYVLRIPSKSLNMVISADMSVCGVSAAVATAAACKAKKEELSLAIGLSLIFTVLMILVQPYIIEWSGMGQVIGGAWIGATVDSTGAVAATGDLVGSTARDVAVVIKMIQNVLIGVVAFGVAIYWVTCVESSPAGNRPSISEIWRRFPRFTIGFIAVSLLMSMIGTQGDQGPALVSSVSSVSKPIREWLFCLAFVSIGLETNFREYKHMLASGKPVLLYVCGQGLNLLLSFLMTWFVFTQLFPEVAASPEVATSLAK